MASRDETEQKEPGRLRQMWDAFQMTRRYDPKTVPLLVAVVLLPIIAGLVAAFVLAPPATNVAGFVLWILVGVVVGALLFLIVLGRRAEKAAYSQLTGRPGAVGAVLKGSLRGGWIASEMPVAVSPRTQDAVYRAVGRGGVVLIGEGPRSRTQRMLEDQRRAVNRAVQNVPVSLVYVGPDEDATPLHKLPRAIRRTPSALRKAEVMAVNSRLTSLGKAGALPIPKGIDPMRVRAPRPR